MKFDVIVIGAGAAGLLCAVEAGRRGRTVAVLDHADQPGKKILISGGGRCNFTNLHCSPQNFLSSNPHFCKSALSRYTPQHFIALVQKHGIAYHEKTLGQLFCDGSARQIVALLLAECRAAGVQVMPSCPVEALAKAEHFQIDTHRGMLEAESVVVASGGLSIPKIGATDLGYRIATQFGLGIIACRPALVPFVLNPEDRSLYCDLSGVSADVVASTGKARFREKMLITHQGLSGPAILQISSYWQPGTGIAIDLTPGQRLEEQILARKLQGEQSLLKNVLTEWIPRRLAERANGAGKTLQELKNRDVSQLAQQLQHWTLTPAGTEGYAKAEVTAGGIDTAELSSQTMESKRVKGLYFIGEVVDVTGHLGGFNFQWAWASGYCAGQYA